MEPDRGFNASSKQRGKTVQQECDLGSSDAHDRSMSLSVIHGRRYGSTEQRAQTELAVLKPHRRIVVVRNCIPVTEHKGGPISLLE